MGRSPNSHPDPCLLPDSNPFTSSPYGGSTQVADGGCERRTQSRSDLPSLAAIGDEGTTLATRCPSSLASSLAGTRSKSDLSRARPTCMSVCLSSLTVYLWQAAWCGALTDRQGSGLQDGVLDTQLCEEAATTDAEDIEAVGFVWTGVTKDRVTRPTGGHEVKSGARQSSCGLSRVRRMLRPRTEGVHCGY